MHAGMNQTHVVVAILNIEDSRFTAKEFFLKKRQQLVVFFPSGRLCLCLCGRELEIGRYIHAYLFIMCTYVLVKTISAIQSLSPLRPPPNNNIDI